MSERRCQYCGADLEGHRPHARFCSGACRAAASRERQARRTARCGFCGATPRLRTLAADLVGARQLEHELVYDDDPLNDDERALARPLAHTLDPVSLKREPPRTYLRAWPVARRESPRVPGGVGSWLHDRRGDGRVPAKGEPPRPSETQRIRPSRKGAGRRGIDLAGTGKTRRRVPPLCAHPRR